MGNHLCAIRPFEFQPYQTLASLGHAKLFDQSIPHDYSKMTKTQSLFISDAIHKATIDVNEERTITKVATIHTFAEPLETKWYLPAGLSIQENSLNH